MNDAAHSGSSRSRARKRSASSGDHRIANGRDGALYMSEVKRILENPMLLMV